LQGTQKAKLRQINMKEVNMFLFNFKKDKKKDAIGLSSLGINNIKIEPKKILTFNMPSEYIERCMFIDSIDDRL